MNTLKIDNDIIINTCSNFDNEQKKILLNTAQITKIFYPDSVTDDFDATVISIYETDFKEKVKHGKNVLVGENVTIGSNCLIGHNTIIEKNVSIGNNCSIGSNTVIRNTIIKNNIEDETTQIMKNIENILKEAGLMFDNVVRTKIYLTNMNDFSAVNNVYGSYFKSNPPARTTIEVSGLPLGVNVEIDMIAVFNN